MAKCPEDVEVLLCNDKECYGIARTPDKKLPGEVKEIKEKEANKLLSSLREEEGVYFGESLKDRQEWLPEAEVKDIEEEPGE